MLPPNASPAYLEIHELDKVSLFAVIFSWFLWSFSVFPWAYVNFCHPLYSMEELSRCISCYVMDHTVALFCVWFICVASLCTSQLLPLQRQWNILEALHATPTVVLVDYCSPYLLSLNLENICALGFVFFLMKPYLSLLTFWESFQLLIYHFWMEGTELPPCVRYWQTLGFYSGIWLLSGLLFFFFFPLNSIKVSAPNFLYSPLSITEHLGSCCWGAWRDISPSFKSLAGCTSGQLSGMNSLTKDWKKPHLSPMELTCYHQCRCYLQRKYKLEGILVSRFF